MMIPKTKQPGAGNAVPTSSGSYSDSESGSYTGSRSGTQRTPATQERPQSTQQQQQRQPPETKPAREASPTLQQQHSMQQQQQQQQFSNGGRQPQTTVPAKKGFMHIPFLSKKSNKDGEKQQQQQQQQSARSGTSREAASQGDASTAGHSGQQSPQTSHNPMTKISSSVSALAGPQTQRITIYLFFCFAFVHFLFMILSCTLSQLDELGGGCFTYWGYKKNCDTVSYNERTSLMTAYPKCRSSLQAGAAFSIFSILLGTATFVVSWLLCCKMRAYMKEKSRKARYLNVDTVDTSPTNGEQEMRLLGGEDGAASAGGGGAMGPFQAGNMKWVAVGIMAGGLVCELICWAIIAGLYSSLACGPKSPTRTTAYGVGFGLAVTAWIAEVLMFVCFIVFV